MKILIFLSIIFVIYPASAVEKIIIQYQIRPPFYIEDLKTGNVNSGIIYDMVKKILNDAKIPYEFEKVPLARSLIEIKQNNKRICFPAANLTNERKKYTNFSIPFFKDKKYVIIARKDDKRIRNTETTNELLKNKDLKLILKVGYSYGDRIDKQIKEYKNYTPSEGALQKNSNLIISSLNAMQILEEIANKGGDYFFMSGTEAEYLLNNYKNIAHNLRQVSLTNINTGSIRSFMCSFKVVQEDIEKINKSIKKIISSHK